jgi:EAL domain-containing protein (putative c-di-GMP-specific phosphodiesterase class I)
LERPTGHVLLVDDDLAIGKLYESVLTEEGYAVQTAGTGREALELILNSQFDVVLTDIRMPDMDGVELLRAVRSSNLDVPVILVTGSPTIETAIQALKLGALNYLMKPLSHTTLSSNVARAVRLHLIAKLKREALAHLGVGDKLVGDRAGLEAIFGRALSSMWLAWQPIVRASDSSVFGHEALLRTDEPMIPNPLAFLAAAERLGRFRELDRAVRGSVTAVDAKVAADDLFVNLHPRSLLDEELYDPEAPLTRRARQVVLEITERACLDGLPDLRDRVRSLRELGYRIAIDDLGAGYAGLASFATLEPDLVKLDMELVRGAETEPVKRKLIGSITRLCKDLGIVVVAEGIETKAGRDTMLELGCDLLQGFLFGRPCRRP